MKKETVIKRRWSIGGSMAHALWSTAETASLIEKIATRTPSLPRL